VIEETSPLYCGIEEFDVFVDGSRKMIDGYVGFYWGKTIDEYLQRKGDIAAGNMADKTYHPSSTSYCRIGSVLRFWFIFGFLHPVKLA